jgi:hypothetical protein
MQRAEERSLGAVALDQRPDDGGDELAGRHCLPACIVEKNGGGAPGPIEEGSGEGPEQGVLVGEPGVQRPGGKAGPARDVLDRDAGDAPVGDDLLGGGEQAIVGGLAARLARRAGSVGGRDAVRPSSVIDMNMNPGSYYTR